MHTRAQAWRWPLGLVLVGMLILVAGKRSAAQIIFARGQNVAPAFEGWELNPDGSFNMVFGYFNRNSDEELDIPIGPGNSVEPGGPDQGQPTHLFPKRNRFTFRVKVPKDFGSKELVWTLTAHGKTEKAYATLKPEYFIDDHIMMLNNANIRTLDSGQNKRPDLEIEGSPARVAKVGEPLRLTAIASDDGIPKPRSSPGNSGALGLRVAWFVYRGSGKVTFSPEQFKVNIDYRGNSPWTRGWKAPTIPRDGKYSVNVTFTEPGTFVLRAMAHDGGLDTTRDVTVTVQPGSSEAQR
jgi:hypothetical protein